MKAVSRWTKICWTRRAFLPYEAIVCSNLNNGERFMTYAMKGKRGRGEIVLNGPTARKGGGGRSDYYFLLRVLQR